MDTGAARIRAGPGLGLALCAFVVLGLPDGTIGAAWPEIADDLEVAVSRLGVLLLAPTGSYLLGCALHGPVVHRLGLRVSLRAATLLTAAGSVTVAAAPSIAAVTLGLILVGAGAATIDTGFNALVATRGDLRDMHRLHTAYGIGSTLGPLAVAALIGLGLSWRLAFLVVAVPQLPLAVAYHRLPADPVESKPRPRGVASWPAVVRSLVAFGVVVAIEVTAVVWTASLLVERGRSTGVAGLWLAALWGSFTLTRMAAAVAGHRASASATLRAGALAVVGAALWLWADPGGAGALSLPLLGAGIAPLFPALAALTPERAGPESTPTVMGWQLAASSVGGAGFPLLVGLLADHHGLGVTGLVIAGLGVAALALEGPGRR